MGRPVLLASIAALSALLAVPASAEGAGPQPRLITVQGQGQVKARPDIGRLTASVETRAASLDAAGRDHGPKAKRAAEILAGLKSRGASVRESAFTMVVDRLGPVLREGGEVPREPISVATTRFDVDVSPLDGLDGIVSALAEAGIFGSSGRLG
jgi:hypothetical protein